MTLAIRRARSRIREQIGVWIFRLRWRLPQGEHPAIEEVRVGRHSCDCHGMEILCNDCGGRGFYDEYGPAICGRSVIGVGTALCARHRAYYEHEYPQGWSYYPGDICRHGRYTGGMGIDHICQACEDGD